MEDLFPDEVDQAWQRRKRELAFVENLQGAEQHWFFIQGMKAAEAKLFLPAVSSLLNGIEATLRIYVHRYGDNNNDWALEPSPYRVLSNILINKAAAIGLPVGNLRFDGEDDFEDALRSEKPNRIDVQIVKLRNNVCHGNLWQFFEDVPDAGIIFVPEMMAETAEQLLQISERWSQSLREFRKMKALV